MYDFDFKGDEKTYEDFVRFFFQFHDPTTLNRQGNDKGTQYASVIFCYDKVQYDIAQRVKAELQKYIDDKKVTCFTDSLVSTDIRPANEFFEAHSEHQDYLSKNPRVRFVE